MSSRCGEAISFTNYQYDGAPIVDSPGSLVGVVVDQHRTTLSSTQLGSPEDDPTNAYDLRKAEPVAPPPCVGAQITLSVTTMDQYDCAPSNRLEVDEADVVPVRLHLWMHAVSAGRLEEVGVVHAGVTQLGDACPLRVVSPPERAIAAVLRAAHWAVHPLDECPSGQAH